MEMFIHIALFLLGVFLIYDGYNSLKKLQENKQKWQKITLQSSSFDKNIYEEYQQADIIVAKFDKFINILSKLSIIDGTIICLGILMIICGFSFYLNLSVIGNIGIILSLAILTPVIWMMLGNSLGNEFEQTLQEYYKSNKKYSLLCNYFEYEYENKVAENKGIIKDYDYTKNFSYKCVASDKSDFFDTGIYITIRFLCVLLFYIGLFLFFWAFIFDNSFYQKIISF
ncbi:MAG: hypothetical protein IKI11_09170 [Neisseriaceae bacterium]|nr:hypothetical protein [Neisseriaceae bacterium]